MLKKQKILLFIHFTPKQDKLQRNLNVKAAKKCNFYVKGDKMPFPYKILQKYNFYAKEAKNVFSMEK